MSSLEIYDFDPLSFEASERLIIADEFADFDAAHIVAVMVPVCVVKAQNPSVVEPADRVVDVGNVVSRDRWFWSEAVAPRLQAQEAAARFFLELMSLSLEHHFDGFFHGLASSLFQDNDRFADGESLEWSQSRDRAGSVTPTHDLGRSASL